MRTAPITATLVATVLLAAGCGDDGDAAPPDSTTSSTTTTTTTPTSTTTSTSTTTTQEPAPVCAGDEVLAIVDAAIGQARLAAGGDWSTETDANRFADRTASGDEFATRLALDCGLTAAQAAGDAERLVIAAWTGPRVAFVIQAGDGPSTPYRPEATVTVSIDATAGEFLDGDDQALWAGTLGSGETFVVGHVDYSLGAAAKDWIAGPRPPFDEEVTLDAERHAIAALEQAGMRNVGIAQPAQPGSEEGTVQFVSPTGQISVADVAPTGWFDPTTPRFYSGPSRVETIGGVEVRVTEPAEGDNLGFTPAEEYGWACDEFVWILEPPFNGGTTEMAASVGAIVETDECTGG